MKEQLVQVIEAFGAAAQTGNALLLKLITVHTNNFLNSIEIVAAEAEGGTGEDAPPSDEKEGA